MKDINIGLIGFGTVGTGVFQLLSEQRELLKGRTGYNFHITRVADLDIERDRGVDVDRSILTTDAKSLINDPKIDIVIELIGGLSPAKEFILWALQEKKHVVTANKALLSESGPDLFAAAVSSNRCLMFEASVGGGIPIIKSIREGLAGNNFKSIYGIINGTSNYIMTRMSADGVDFKRALELAQKKGYAEADPALDVSGADAAHKLAILASLASGKWIHWKSIHVEGITEISQMDIEYARKLGYSIKLLAIMKQSEQGIELRVHPTLLPEKSLMASVNDTYNAIAYSGDYVDNGMLFGRGAGRRPTASAIVSDLIDIARVMSGGVPLPFYDFTKDAGNDITAFDNVECRNYLRVKATDKPGVLAQIAGVLGKNNISIASVIQKERSEVEQVPVVMMTHKAKEKDFQLAAKELDRLNVVKGRPVRIRVEDEL